MIETIERLAREMPEGECFRFIDANGSCATGVTGGRGATGAKDTRGARGAAVSSAVLSWSDLQLQGVAAVRLLAGRGVGRGDAVAIDVPNCAAYPVMLAAAAYGGFVLATLNNRLAAAEKRSRLEGLAGSRLRVATLFDEDGLSTLLAEARSVLAAPEGRASVDLAAQRLVERFDAASPAVVMFTSGTTGSSKAAILTWDNLCGSAQAANAALGCVPRGGLEGGLRRDGVTDEDLGCEEQGSDDGAGLDARPSFWQAALPLYHVGGLQIVVRSVLAGRSFALYRRFDAQRLLADAARLGATHVSVVDKMLRDLLDAAEADADAARALRAYRCILLGGAAANPATLTRAFAASVRVYLSYGMTETSSAVAATPILADSIAASSVVAPTAATPTAATSFAAVPVATAPVAAAGETADAEQSVDQGLSCAATEASLAATAASISATPLTLFPGYRTRILDPDAEGFGRLAVAGPGVIGGYANAPCETTADGFFVTGDCAALVGEAIVVRERAGDLFVSGGENVYPAEIAAELLAAPGVGDAFVFGAADETWGRRPVALIERDQTDAGRSPFLARELRARLSERLSRISRPDRVIALDAFPRSGIGKIDRRALERRYEKRIDVVDARLHRVTLPFVRPFETASGILRQREVLLVELIDACGRVGIGECSSFATDWYLPETIAEDECVMRDVILPFVQDEAFAHPADAYRALAALPEVAPYPMARAAVEMALWDLYGQAVRAPLWQLIGGEASQGAALSVPAASENAATDAAAPGDAAFGCTMPDSSQSVAAPDASQQNASRPNVATEPATVRVPVGAVVGMAAADETVSRVRRLVQEGYRRVKLKIAPGTAWERVRAVRAAFPDLPLSLDANQSFTEADLTELRKLDGLGATWIEEPLAFTGTAANQRDPAAAELRFAQLARLQRELATPLCLDESFFTIDEARAALANPELRCFAIKIGKFGGIAGALAFVREALAAGARVWMGGMYDTGIARSVHAAFETLPSIDDPGDLGTVAHYFGRDLAQPPYTADNGFVSLNDVRPYGIGCKLAASQV